MRLMVNAISAKQGGIVTYTRNLLRSLDERGVDVTVAAPPGFDATPADRLIPMTASFFPPWRRLVWEQTIWPRIVARHKPDVLFSSANFGLLSSGIPQLLLIREGGLFDPDYLKDVAPAQGLRNAVLRKRRRNLILLSARRAAAVMTPTVAVRDLVSLWAPELRDRIIVNNYGTLSDKFAPVGPRRAWREDGVLRLLYVSVYYPHKNPGVILDAVDRLIAAGIPAHATITMDRDEIPHMNGSAHDIERLRLGEENGTVNLGRRRYDDLPELYRTHDAFVFPSVSETFGHPMIEALGTGIPSLLADTPVNQEVSGDAALYFAAFRASALVARLRELDADPELRARLSTAGRERVVARFDWDRHVDRLMAVFDALAAGRSVTPDAMDAA